MKLKNDFIPHKLKGEVMLVATGSADFSGLVRGNELFGEILDLLKNETTEADVVKALREIYDAPEGKIEADVHKVVVELKKIGALEGV